MNLDILLMIVICVLVVGAVILWTVLLRTINFYKKSIKDNDSYYSAKIKELNEMIKEVINKKNSL